MGSWLLSPGGERIDECHQGRHTTGSAESSKAITRDPGRGAPNPVGRSIHEEYSSVDDKVVAWRRVRAATSFNSIGANCFSMRNSLYSEPAQLWGVAGRR